MKPHTLRALEFDAVRAMLRARVGSAGGRLVVDALAPLTSAHEVRRALARTTEAGAILASTGRQPYQDLPDLAEAFHATRAAGAQLTPATLLDVASFCSLATDAARAVARCPGAETLGHLAGSVADLTDLAGEIRAIVLPSGEIADNASPRLGEIRRAVLRARAQLQSVMDSYLRGKDAARVLQERLIATRNDRYVLLLKAECRGQIPGIIHGGSSSGASLFVEPLPAVEINNDMVSLADDERREIQRILQELTARVHDRLEDLEHALDVMTRLDALQAQALLARDMQAACPVIVDDLRLDLRDARHPLLMAALTEPLGAPRRAIREPVPVSIRVDPEAAVLVISGPNTGGKTVALKTAGLLALMAQCGLHLPAAEGSVLPVFQSIFADIGDDQSIAADLSTFSAHLANVVDMTHTLTLPALVLLDEVGSGTEPSEGGALGVALVDHFRQRGAMVLATTHHGLMKTYAQTTPGVVCGSFGYDPATYAPNYRLSIGTPGRSLALEMAERLGLPGEILAAARARVDRREADLEALARRLEMERAAIETAHAQADEERRSLEKARADQERRLQEIEDKRRSDVGTFLRQLERKSVEAFRKADDAIRQSLARLEAARGQALRGAARARREAREALEAARSEVLSDPDLETPQAAAPATLAHGERVRVGSLGVVGTVLAAHENDDVDLDVAGKRLRVPRSELTALAAPAGTPRRTSAPVDAPTKTVPVELNIIGLTIEEALPRVDKLLDDAILSDRGQLRIIHGHGAGRLREAVRTLLRENPQVASFRPGGPREGGNGATIVELKE